MSSWNLTPTAFALALALALTTTGCGGGGGGGGGNSDGNSASAPTTSSTSTSTSTTSTAPTTTLGSAASYTVAFALQDTVTLGTLQIEVVYAAAGGGFVGSGQNVSCSSPLTAAGVLVAFGDDDSGARLSFAALALGGFDGPTSIASCEFSAAGPAPTPGDFAITVVEANGLDLSPIDPVPTVRVASIRAQ